MKIKKNPFFLNSIKYIFVSGASKGFSYILLLYLAIGGYTDQYVTILLLLSLEQVLSLLLPLNNPNIIYSKTIVQYEEITNKLVGSSVLVVAFYIIVFLIFQTYVFDYFDQYNILVFAGILVNVLINSYVVYLTNYYKIVEKHKTALFLQALLLISFVSILIFICFFEDKVIAFFIGKAVGLAVVLTILSLKKLNLTKYKFILMSSTDLKKMLNLLSVSVLGWVSGLGFMNIAKIYASPDELPYIGYVLNICNVFLLVSIGVNSVYNPLIKKYLLENNINRALKTQTVTLLIYLGIGLLSYIIYLAFSTVILDLSFNDKVTGIISMIPYAILIFIFGTFQSVSHPFYLINDKFSDFNIINILSYIIWLLIMLIAIHFGYSNFIWFLIVIYFIKASFAYLYARLKFMNKEN